MDMQSMHNILDMIQDVKEVKEIYKLYPWIGMVISLLPNTSPKRQEYKINDFC